MMDETMKKKQDQEEYERLHKRNSLKIAKMLKNSGLIRNAWKMG